MSGWGVLLALGLGAVVGYAYGLIAAVLALLGLILGGGIGFRIAAAITLGSPGWTLLGALAGALGGASLLGRLGRRARARLRIPGLGLADGVLGAVLGAGVALTVLWWLAPGFTALSLSLPRAPAGARPGILTRIEQSF
jgi:hypothetical protein